MYDVVSSVKLLSGVVLCMLGDGLLQEVLSFTAPDLWLESPTFR